MDGTFDAAAIFYQLYIIYGWYKGEMYPCAYIFLENKSSNTYQKIFQHLKNNSYGFKLNPKIIMSDFENGLISAVRIFFNNKVVHLGCHFHFTNALVKNISIVGLKSENEEPNSEIHKWLRLFTLLPFVQPENLQQAFNSIIKNKPIFNTVDLENKVQKFINYFIDTWMPNGKQYFNLNSILNHFENEGPRTNNHAEAHNSALNKAIGQNPNFYKVIEAIKVQENYHVWKFLANKSGKSWSIQRRSIYIKRDLLFQQHKNKYLNSIIDLDKFISNMFDISKKETCEDSTDCV